MRIGQLKVKTIAIQPEPDAATKGAKDQLQQVVSPSDVQVILCCTTDQKANAAPKLPGIDPEGEALCISDGQRKVTCKHACLNSIPRTASKMHQNVGLLTYLGPVYL